MGVTHPFKAWANEVVVGGTPCQVIPCGGYRSKTFILLTSIDGDVTVEIEPGCEPISTKEWFTLHTDLAIGIRTAANAWVWRSEHDFMEARVSFSVDATLTLIAIRGDP